MTVQNVHPGLYPLDPSSHSLKRQSRFNDPDDGSLMALDGKISTDDNALFRQPKLQEWKSQMPQPAAEKRAAKANLSYSRISF